VFPYPVPETLLWTTHYPEYVISRTGKREMKPNHSIIILAKKWIKDITSGESFYKRNKDYFTKAEAHYFLSSRLAFNDTSSVVTLYFYAKCRARSLNHKLSMMIAEVFTAKFLYQFKNRLVESFLDLLSRTPDYRYERGMLGDISDFVLEKIRENENEQNEHRHYTFSGRTITSIIALTNEWHERLRRPRGAHRNVQIADPKIKNPIDTSHWKGMGLAQFRHETEDYLYTVTELRTAQDLVNEGRKMKNCIASYNHVCAFGNCAIFTVERIHPNSQIIEKAATLEVQISNRTLIQAKGKCNSIITPKVSNIVTRWAQTHRIKAKLIF
jgi:hypothetical protein